jgi:chorismate-pyruvate lyase
VIAQHIQALPNYAALTLFQKALLATDGTVTDLLALYAGQAIRAHKIAQTIAPRAETAEVPAVLTSSDDARILHREIVLMAGAEPLLHAESFFLFERFSKATQTALLETETPIGYLWQREKTEMFREIVAITEAPYAKAARALGVGSAAVDATPLVSRSYLIRTGGAPLGIITERFLATALRG